MISAPPPSPTAHPDASSGVSGIDIVNQMLDVQTSVPHARLTPEEYTRRISLSQYVTETDAPYHNMESVKTQLIKLVEINSKIWDWDRLQISKFARDQWVELAIQMYEKSGRLFHTSSLVKWWTSLESEFRNQLERNTQSTWLHTESMDFIRQKLQTSIEKRRENKSNIDKTDFEKIDDGKGEVLESILDSVVESVDQNNRNQRSFHVRHGESSRLCSGPRPISELSEAEHYERDINFIKYEVNCFFGSIKNDPAKFLEAKKKLLNFLWGMEFAELNSRSAGYIH